MCKQALRLAPAPQPAHRITTNIMQLIITSRNQVNMTVIDYYKSLYPWLYILDKVKDSLGLYSFKELI